MELNDNICRICLEQNIIMNWNDEILEFCGFTYRDCYYKYTQLDMLDPYSQMLCKTCSIDLKNSHSLVEKALKSHDLLQRTYDAQIMYIENEELKEKTEPEEFEVLILNENDETLIENTNDGYKERNKLSKIQEKRKRRFCKKPKWIDDNTFEVAIPKLVGKCEQQEIDIQPKIEVQIKTEKLSNTRQEYEADDSREISPSKEEPNRRKTYSKKIFMCSICSKTYKAKNNLIKHEEIHRGHRKRSEICPHCGIKLLCKNSMQLHLKVHDTNREKFKCDFCDKVYPNRGGLKIHSRIHLGQMIPCPICSKEFYRQIDLDRHNIAAHSGATIHTDADAKKLSKYYVYCKECNKHLRSTTWRAHQAAHLKEPLMECSLCSKTFFSRSTCTYHMQKVHNYNKRDEYEQFIIHLKNRLTHLMMKQQGVIQPIET